MEMSVKNYKQSGKIVQATLVIVYNTWWRKLLGKPSIVTEKHCVAEILVTKHFGWKDLHTGEYINLAGQNFLDAYELRLKLEK